MDNYQKAAIGTLIVRKENRLPYLVTGLANEAGEVAGKYKKFLRDDIDMPTLKADMVGELGDVLWYIAALSDELGIPLSEIAEHNLEKLRSRKERGCIKGNGDNR